MFKFLFIILFLFLIGCSNTDNKNEKNGTDNNSNIEKLSSVHNSIENNYTSNIKSEEQIGTFTTTIYTKTDERQNNVKIACSELNGTTVAPGKTFSFTETLGPAHPDDGYQKAETFDSDGDIIQEYGGGKCQISSTLYNAVLASPNLIVVERHEHSNYVPYVEDGKDATVSYGSTDLKFRNDNNYTIRIDATCTEDEVTINIIKI